jgi:lauroyl/myristoyl acyltransferase
MATTAPTTSAKKLPTPASAPASSLPRWKIQLILFFATLAARFLIWLAGYLSPANGLRVATWVTARFEPLTRRRRFANYQKYFGSDPQAAEKIAALDAGHQKYLSRMRAEMARGLALSPMDLSAFNELVGREHLQKLLDEARGLMLVSTHAGSWWFIPSLLSLSGFKVTVIFAPIAYKPIERYLLDTVSRYGVKVAFVGRDAWLAVKQAPEKKEIVYLAFDVALQPKRVEWLSVGESRLAIDPAPAILAAKANLPVLQASHTHLANGQDRVVIHPPQPTELQPKNHTPAEISRVWGERLNDELRSHPEQWWGWSYVELAAAEPKQD